MKPVNLTYLLLQLSCAVDSGLDSRLTVNEARDRIMEGGILDYVDEMDDRVDLSLLDQETRRDIESRWRNILHAYTPGDLGIIEDNGMALLISLATQLLQGGFSVETNDWCWEEDRVTPQWEE